MREKEIYNNILVLNNNYNIKAWREQHKEGEKTT